MEAALARRAASIRISSSIRWSFTGVLVLCMRKTSRPRTFSPISAWISPSEKRVSEHFPSGCCRYSQTSRASGTLELPERTTKSAPLPGGFVCMAAF
jgi:hypothetical protein